MLSPTVIGNHVVRPLSSRLFPLLSVSAVASLIPFRSQTFVRSLPNATLAFAVLAVTSLSMRTALESASKIGEFINNLKFLSIHSDGWFDVRLSRCWLVYCLSLFFANNWSGRKSEERHVHASLNVRLKSILC